MRDSSRQPDKGCVVLGGACRSDRARLDEPPNIPLFYPDRAAIKYSRAAIVVLMSIAAPYQSDGRLVCCLQRVAMNDPNPLKLIPESELNPVPVFSCIVILGSPDETGRRQARVANLAGITAEGASERDLLTAIMKKFRAVTLGFTERGEQIPWIEPPETPGKGESQRFIPVHL